MTDIVFSSTAQLAKTIRARDVSAVEVLDAHLAQIERHNPALNAIVTLDAERARERAREADEALARDDVWGPLHGVPFTLKDAFATAGVRTTIGSPIADHVPDEDSTVAARLKAAGAILMGKTNVPPMLADFQTNNPIFGRSNNPWDVERTPGGSSGGAAAAVAAGMTPFDIGTDLSGSLRIPAHFCGLFGLKPTENRVSAYGFMAGLPAPRSVRVMSSVGPMARSVDDLSLLYSLIAGPDGRDTEIAPVPVQTAPPEEVDDVHLGFVTTFPGLPVAAAIGEAIEGLAQELNRCGFSVEEAQLPGLDFTQELQSAGALLGMMVGAFQPQEQGQPTSLAQYLEALHRRDQSILAWEQFFEEWDALLCPVSITPAFPHTETGSPLPIDGQEADYWLVSAHTTLFNYSGHPAVVLPCGLDGDGLPVGLQVVGGRWDEARLLAVARALSQVTGAFRRPAF